MVIDCVQVKRLVDRSCRKIKTKSKVFKKNIQVIKG
jgi:hypothetical protein